MAIIIIQNIDIELKVTTTTNINNHLFLERHTRRRHLHRNLLLPSRIELIDRINCDQCAKKWPYFELQLELQTNDDDDDDDDDKSIYMELGSGS